MTMPTTTPAPNAAVLTIDGETVAQARLDRPQDLELIKAEARRARREGRQVTLRKGIWSDAMTVTCGVCGEGQIHYRFNTEGDAGDDMMGATCPKCCARIGGCNGRLGRVYSWMSTREVDAANHWYEAQLFGADGDF